MTLSRSFRKYVSLVLVGFQVPFKHDSLLVDRKEMKLTKAEKREAKRGIQTCVLCSSYDPSLRSALRTSPNLYPRRGGVGEEFRCDHMFFRGDGGLGGRESQSPQ